MWDDNIYGTTGGSTGSSWEGTSQLWQGAGSVLDKLASYKLASMQLQQRGETGYYNEGQPARAAGQGASSDGGGTLLLIGGALVLFLLLKD